MKKTTIQKLIKDIKEVKKRKVDLTMDGVIVLLENSLESEKAQIMEALEEGIKYGKSNGQFDYPASRYFNSTFEKNK